MQWSYRPAIHRRQISTILREVVMQWLKPFITTQSKAPLEANLAQTPIQADNVLHYVGETGTYLLETIYWN